MGIGLAYLKEPMKTKNSVDGSGFGISYGASEMQGWRKNMEDAHITISNFGGDNSASLFAIFDGHGGPEVALYAQKHFPSILLKTPEYSQKDHKKALISAFLELDKKLNTKEGRAEILTMGKDVITTQPEDKSIKKEEPTPEETGCTANVLLIIGNTLYVANAGDSRAILIQGNGATLPLSHDHKPDQDIEIKRILKAGGSVFNGRVNGDLNLSRAIGDLKYKANANLSPEEQMITAYPDVATQILSNDIKFVVMGCDGIYDNKTNQQIGDFLIEDVKKYPKCKISERIERLLDSLLSPSIQETKGKGCDNMTCIIIQFIHSA